MDPFCFLAADIGRGWCLGRGVLPSIKPFRHSTAILYTMVGSIRYKTRLGETSKEFYVNALCLTQAFSLCSIPIRPIVPR